MMILCPYCHDAATKGAIPEEEQRRIQANPHNLARGYASGAIKINQSYCAIACGETMFIGSSSVINVDQEPLLKMSVGADGYMEISANLYDEQGNTLAVIDRNEWISGDPAIWDMESDHQRLTIRAKKYKVSLMIDAKGEPVRLHGRFFRHGQTIRLNSSGFSVDGGIIHDSQMQGIAFVGFSIDFDTVQEKVQFVPYLGTGMIVSEWDPIQRLIKAVDAWKKLTEEK